MTIIPRVDVSVTQYWSEYHLHGSWTWEALIGIDVRRKIVPGHAKLPLLHVCHDRLLVRLLLVGHRIAEGALHLDAILLLGACRSIDCLMPPPMPGLSITVTQVSLSDPFFASAMGQVTQWYSIAIKSAAKNKTQIISYPALRVMRSHTDRN